MVVRVTSSPPGELLSEETNDTSVAILLSYGTARVLLAGDAEAGEEYLANRCYTRPLMVIKFETTKLAQLRFRAALTEDDARMHFHREMSDWIGEALA